MITKKITPLTLGIFALCACAPTSTTTTSSSIEEEEFNWVSPVGIPAIAFFNQGENENWTSTNTPASIIPSAFANGTFDAIVRLDAVMPEETILAAANSVEGYGMFVLRMPARPAPGYDRKRLDALAKSLRGRARNVRVGRSELV